METSGDQWRKEKKLPNTQQVPDYQPGVEAVQAEGHPGRRDAVGRVEDMSGQGAGLRHRSHGSLWTGEVSQTDLCMV